MIGMASMAGIKGMVGTVNGRLWQECNVWQEWQVWQEATCLTIQNKCIKKE